ncbi:MAG: sigma-70 family RNA polymerase sigma factor [Pseudomonadota bacterium]
MNSDAASMLELFIECKSELTRFLRKRLGSWNAASDVAHDVFLKLHDFESPADLQNRRAYLFRMAANLAKDRLRVEQRRREILATESDGLVPRIDEITPERQALARAELEEMRAEIARLPHRRRRVFALYRFEGMSQKEIAETLGIGITTVQHDLKKAMDALVGARRRFAEAEDPQSEHRSE